jgi:hypothetical protein
LVQDKIVIKMYGGQEVSAQDDLNSMVGSGFDQRAGLPDAQSLRSAQDTNAFATGVIRARGGCVTDGIRRISTKGTCWRLGSELSHVKTAIFL